MHFKSIGIFLIICGVVAAGHNHHATSYSMVRKHDGYHNGGKGYGHSHVYRQGLGYNYGYRLDHGNDYGDHGHNHYYQHPSYKFKYGVKHVNTGDIKNQWEHRNDHHFKGSYSLKESDGTIRIVNYSAGGPHGFNAVAKKIGHTYQPRIYHHQKHQSGGYNAGHYGYQEHHGHATSYVNVKRY